MVRRRGLGLVSVAVLVLVLLLLLLATGCRSESDGESDPELGSETDREPSTNGDPADGGSDGSGGGQGTGSSSEADSTPELEPPLTVEPTDRFQRLPAERFGNASTQIDIRDSVRLPGGALLLAGGLEDGGRRTVQATVSVVDPDRPDQNRRIALPAGDGGSTANGVAVDGDTVLVAGELVTAELTDGEEQPTGVARPVIWAGGTDLESWSQSRLPTDDSALDVSAHLVVAADGIRYAVGQARIGGLDRLIAWSDDGTGWQQLETIGGGVDDGLELTAGAATVTGDGLVVVGYSTSAGTDPRPRVWLGADDVLRPVAGTGLPAGGRLLDVTAEAGGGLVAVGSMTEEGISTPVLARSDDPSGPWTVVPAEVDLAGWVSFGGVEFGRLAIDGDDLYTALTNPVVQQVSRSSDGGRTWDRVGNLSFDSFNFAPAGALLGPGSGRADDSIVLAGSDVVVRWTGSGWSPVADRDAIPVQQGALEATDVVAGPRGFAIGGGRNVRSDGELRFEAVVWQSSDGRSWGRPPVDQAVGHVINELHADASDPDGPLAGFKGGGSYFTPVSVVRPDATGRWRAAPLPVGEAFLDHSLGGVDGSIVAAGNRPRADLSQTDPLFVVVEPDDRVREVPLTNSPVPSGANASVGCLAGSIGSMMALLEWGDGDLGVAVGTNGERWRGLEIGDELAGLVVTACHRDERGFLLGGSDEAGRAMVARSSDGRIWSIEPLGQTGAVLGIDEIDGALYLSGWAGSADGSGRDGTVWKPVGGSWQPIADSGLAGDRFARFTEVSGLAARDGIVVAVGTDRGRAGAWIATTAVLR